MRKDLKRTGYQVPGRLCRVLICGSLLGCCLAMAGAALADDQSLPSDQPVEVSLGLYLLDILAIDDSEQTVTIDFGVSARWVDKPPEITMLDFRSIPSRSTFCWANWLNTSLRVSSVTSKHLSMLWSPSRRTSGSTIGTNPAS